jgi:chromosome segregation ATPase
MFDRSRISLTLCLIALAAPALALEQRERIELADLLTLDDEAALAEADEAFTDIQSRLFEAESELDVARADFALVGGPVEEADEELAAAEAELADAIAEEAPREEILDLEDVVHAAKEWLEEAAAEVEPYEEVRAEAQEAFDALKQEYWEARRALDHANKEIAGTSRLIERLDDRRATALYEAMLDAAERDALPLDIDLEALELIRDKQLSRRAIAKLPSAFEAAREDGRDGLVVFLCMIGDEDCPDSEPAPGSVERDGEYETDDL